MQFDELVAAQAGRFTRGQAIAAGFSSFRIARRIERGEWRVVRGRVLAVVAAPPSSDARDWEAILSAGPGAVLAAFSAARNYGMDPPDARSCILVPRPRRLDVPTDVIVLRRSLGRDDLVIRDDVMLTGQECTVVDCAFLLDEQRAMPFLERALQRRWISFDDLTRRVQLASGRRDVQKVVRSIRALGSGARSDAERRLVSGLRRHGVRDWSCNVEVSDRDGLIGLVDVAFPAIRLAVELDGRAWHIDRDRFQHDRTRQNRLVAAGWTVLRFTWEDVAHRLDQVIAEIRGAIARLSGRR
jgi:very-short-patch-repair endonuclease